MDLIRERVDRLPKDQRADYCAGMYDAAHIVRSHAERFQPDQASLDAAFEAEWDADAQYDLEQILFAAWQAFCAEHAKAGIEFSATNAVVFAAGFRALASRCETLAAVEIDWEKVENEILYWTPGNRQIMAREILTEIQRLVAANMKERK